ncbi:EndoU domain-containing protein [Rivularia sp. UHCC 0363]|uniref:EndoU domain-containing protein n=1 Tax=Rivularia sp. UHCC 0363 TaxID=3110244 RepID=UPI002B1EE6CD|nr:EndoU domain-containing protein [Rivularia sp. UHCC 0363]MEA5597976.1 EndoU domain-containing protein [Rivularia sp. UHCC 0363]
MKPNTASKLKRIFSGLTTLVLLSSIGLNSPANSQQQNTELLPFFDNQDNPVPVNYPSGAKLDITPPAPQLNSFDKAVLKTCGPIGTRVSSNQFKQLLSNHPEVLTKIQQATKGELRPGRKSKSEFLQDLTNVWFKNKGFEHIFCGEIYNANDIGGLHFAGRYLQLQQEKIAGRLPVNPGRQEVVPGVIYTMGVIIKQPNRTIRDDIKGYGYLSNAEELLVDVTKVFKQQENLEGACIYQQLDQETGKTFPTVFVAKNQGIITFYPDATPKGKKCKV